MREAASAGAAGGASLLERVMAARGLGAGAEAQRFLDPRLSDLHDPSLLPGIDVAAERLVRAAKGGEAIVIYGDYDVDGVTATAIVYHMLKAIEPGARVSTYVPHRLEEGYGLNGGAIRELAEAGAKVIVSVDCGITAVEPAREAARAGVDLIITDHHTPPGPGEEMPGALSLVHPRLPGCEPAYPFGELCGAGVAYKLAWRMAVLASGSARVREDLKALLVELLAHAALGVIADVVPLVGENRVLARYGLGRIRSSPLPGLASLVRASGLGSEKVNEMDVGFKLGPRLNAAGRMGHAAEAVELFTTAVGARAEEISARLSRQNDDRREVERGIFERACVMAEEQGMTAPGRRAIVLAHPEWHAGVVGIVCSRLVERFGRPAILMQVKDGVCHGSGRSIDGFDLHRALTACAPSLMKFGGHAMAAGVHVEEARLAEFREALVAEANRGISEDRLMPAVEVDCEAPLSALTREVVRDLERLAPFGRENPEVRVLVRGLRVTRPARLMGAGGKHLSIEAAAEGRVVRCVGWSWGEHAGKIAAGATIDVIVRPKISTFGGGETVEPILEDAAVR